MSRAQSYTSIALYKKCPKAWAARYIEGLRGPPSRQASRGDDLHAQLEAFFRGAPYPAGTRALAPWRRFMEHLTLYNPSPELNSAVKEDWTGCDYEDPTAYLRGKADLRYVDANSMVHILDWKSGRVYPDHPNQGLLYVALDVSGAEDYETEFVYLDMPTQTVPRRYKNVHRDAEIQKLRNIITTMEQDTEHAATPSYEGCKYCHLSWRVGGSCRSAP